MNTLFFLKPIVDMLYEYQVLDVILILIGMFFLFQKPWPKMYQVDYVVITLMGLFLFSFLKNIDGYVQLIKIESGFLLFFLGRLYYKRCNKYISKISDSFLIVLLVCLLTYVTGMGFKQWGTRNTFCGPYFFKTDLAAAMAQSLVLYSFCIGDRKMNYLTFLPFLCLFFIMISNARMYYFISVFIIFLYISYYLERKYHIVIVKLNANMFMMAFMILIIVLLLLNYLGSILGDQYLLFQFTGVDDIYSDSNTQGRNNIWADIYSKFTNSSFFYRLTGVDLCTDISDLGHNSHNMYLKVLYSTGYLGCFFFFYFLYLLFNTFYRLRDRRWFFICLSFLTIYILSGVSYSSIESTQLTWLPMFFAGAAVSKSNKSNLLILLKKRRKEW